MDRSIEPTHNFGISTLFGSVYRMADHISKLRLVFALITRYDVDQCMEGEGKAPKCTHCSIASATFLSRVTLAGRPTITFSCPSTRRSASSWLWAKSGRCGIGRQRKGDATVALRAEEQRRPLKAVTSTGSETNGHGHLTRDITWVVLRVGRATTELPRETSMTSVLGGIIASAIDESLSFGTG